jgi:hypothetical protein
MFKSKSLEGILSSFTQVQADLTAFVARTNAQRDNHLEESEFHANAAVAKTAEIARAENVMAKINDLIS